MMCEIIAALTDEGFSVSTQPQEKIKFDGSEIVITLDGFEVEHEDIETYCVRTRVSIDFVMRDITDIKDQVLKIVKAIEDRLRKIHCEFHKFEGIDVEGLGTGYLISVLFSWDEVVEVK